MEMILTQHDVVGSDDDGSRDANFSLDQGSWPGSAWFDGVAPARIGHETLRTSYVTYSRKRAHYFRFRLPLNANPNLDIEQMHLRLWFNANEDLPLDHHLRSAQHVLTPPIEIGFYSSNDAPIPSSAAECESMWYSIQDKITWYKGHSPDPRYVIQAQTDNLAAQDSDLLPEAATIRQSGWTLGNNILIFLVPVDDTSPHDHWIEYRTWSHIKEMIRIGKWSEKELDTVPQLYIKWSQKTPGKGDNHVEHILVITQDYSYIFTKREAEHTLTFTQDISFVLDRYRSLEDTLEIEQDINLVGITSVTITQLLPIYQDVKPSRIRGNAVEHELNISQTITLGKVFSPTVEHQLTITQSIMPSGLYEKDVDQTFTITQDISTNELSEAKKVEHTLIIQQTITTPGSALNKSIESTMTVTHVYVGYVKGTESGSGGGGGGGSSAECDDDTLLHRGNKPLLIPGGTVTLTYSSYTAALPAPILGNMEELRKIRIQRKTRAGDSKILVDESWPRTIVFKMKFEALTDQQKLDLFTLIGASLGQQVTLTDHEGRTWNGIISNPNGEYSKIFRDCGHTAEFDFQVIE